MGSPLYHIPQVTSTHLNQPAGPQWPFLIPVSIQLHEPPSLLHAGYTGCPVALAPPEGTVPKASVSQLPRENILGIQNEKLEFWKFLGSLEIISFFKNF